MCTRYSIIACNIFVSFCKNRKHKTLKYPFRFNSINAHNTQPDLINALGHPVNQGEACL